MLKEGTNVLSWETGLLFFDALPRHVINFRREFAGYHIVCEHKDLQCHLYISWRKQGKSSLEWLRYGGRGNTGFWCWHSWLQSQQCSPYAIPRATLGLRKTKLNPTVLDWYIYMSRWALLLAWRGADVPTPRTRCLLGQEDENRPSDLETLTHLPIFLPL